MSDSRRRRIAGYSDPAIGAAFENLADVFAPPSATDILAGTKAASEREKAKRLADVYSRATAPGATIQALDLPAIAAGLYAPTQSGYAVDTDATTRRRGQDIESGDRRYGVDVGSRTALATNAADNDRALRTAIMAPTPKDAIVTRPPAIAQRFGVPESTTGVIAAQPGERNYLPDGRVLEGAPKPQTMDEVKAAAFNRLPAEVQEGAAAKDLDIVDVIMDGQRVPMTAPQRLAAGAPAVSDKRPQVFNSAKGPVRWDPVQQRYVSVQSGQPADVSGGLQAPSAAQGSEGVFGASKANITDANKRDAEDTSALATLDIYETLIRNNPGSIGIVGTIRGIGQNAIGTAQDLAAAFGSRAPEMRAAAESIREGMTGIAPELFDPAIPEAAFLQGALAYSIARTENPGGEVSRQAYERALERLQGGGILANQQSALAQINAYRKVLRAKQGGTAALRDPSQGRKDTGYRSPDGSAPGLPSVGQNGEGYDQLAPGAEYVGPDGRVRTKR